MGYTGEYDCPVNGCGFDVAVVADRYETKGFNTKPVLIRGTATQGRATILAHGQEVHAQDWTNTRNEIFLPETVV